MLSVNQLYFEREEGAVLFEGLNLSVKPSQLLEITGPNGVGKTTLLRLLAGFLRPTAGDIAVAAAVAYLGHNPPLTSWLTAQENLDWTGQLHQVPTQGLLEKVCLEGSAGCFPGQLSQGQKKRLGLALLLAKKADIWLLDEPMAGLDKKGQMFIQGMISDHLNNNGCVVMTTHHEIEWGFDVEKLLLRPI